jgi:uncharacterized peroxidase-related enzyme
MARPDYDLLARPRTTPEERAETKIQIVRESEADGETAAVYQYFRDKTGRQDVPGILKCFATDPAYARQMVDLSSSLLFSDGKLDRRHKEMIATWTSCLNRCPYCFDSHGSFLKVQGGSEAMLRSLAARDLGTPALTDAERRLLAYVEKVNDASFRTTREDVVSLIEAGWSEDQIAETVHVATIMGLCNRVANAFGLHSQDLLALQS